jgi:hypothetical protein
VLAGGGDWLTMPADGIARMDIRATLRTDTGDHVHYTGLGRTVLAPGALDRFLAGETIEGDGVHGRTAPLFETASPTYDWLNRVVAVGRVLDLSLHHIRYEVFALR